VNNPYKILGLEEGVSDEEIKKAFRNLAKANHPDKGGDSSIFAKISRAFALIRTQERRERFKKDGGKRKKSLKLNAMEVICVKLIQSIRESKTPKELKFIPLIYRAKKSFRIDIKEFKKEFKTLKKDIIIWEDLIDRFTYKGKEEEENFLIYALNKEIDALRKSKNLLRRQMKIAFKAIKLLDDYDFKNELKKESTHSTFTFININIGNPNTSTSFWGKGE